VRKDERLSNSSCNLNLLFLYKIVTDCSYNLDQCDGMIGGFAVGDEISIVMNGGNFRGGVMASGKVENMTSGNSVDCGGNEAVMDTPLLSVLVCESENSQISSFTNGNFMTMLVDFS